jgi:RHS repeat-associated protein
MSFKNFTTTPLFAWALLVVSCQALAQANMTWHYGYDPAGNPTSVTDPNGQRTTTTFDALQRPVRTTIQAPSGAGTNPGGYTPSTATTYNGQGSVTSVTDPRNLTTRYSPNGLGNLRAQQSPDTGTQTRTFDVAGRLLTQTDARGQTTAYTYEVLGRVKTIHYAGVLGASFDYDNAGPGSIGQLTQMSDESGVTSFSYDPLSRPIRRAQLIDGKLINTAYSWGTVGTATNQITAITYPSGAVIGYAYDYAGRVQSISALGSTVLAGITYNADNQVTGWTWGNGIRYQRTYDAFGRLSSYPLATMTRTLSYDNAGRITAFSHPNPGLNQAFGYNGFDQLTQHGLQSAAHAYVYDPNGNRILRTTGGISQVSTISPSSNQITSVKGTGPAIVQAYDAAGHLIADGSTSYTYSERGRRRTARVGGQLVTYRYNALEQRVSKTGPLVPSGAMYYAYTPNGLTLGEYSADLAVQAETVYLGDTPVAVLKQVGPKSAGQLSVSHVYADHINTPRVITRPQDGAVLWRWDTAEAFGASAADEDPSRLGQFKYNQRMPGQIFDQETNTFYNVHRNYRPTTGSYEQSDPIGLDGGINTYAYVGGNPVSFVDSTGLICDYSQGSGAISCTDAVGQNYYKASGYAGTGKGRNNPDFQGQASIGPLPRGNWQVTGDWYNSPNTGRNTIRLTPMPGNECAATTRDCSSFRIHGNNARNDASHGCIVLPLNRTIIPPGEVVRVGP